MKSLILLSAAAIAACSLGTGVNADEPLYAKNLSPVAGLFGLPSQRNAATLAAGQFSAALHSSIANHYIRDSDGDEWLNFDGETWRLAFEARLGLADGWDLQLEVPWLDHSGGNLDGVIDDWHDLWGMPDGGRSNVERDLLDYRYRGQDEAFLLEDDNSGMGDINLSLTHRFYQVDYASASVALGYKFATGDEDDFLGSGAQDAWLALRYSAEQLSNLPLRWHGQLGYLHAGDSDLLGKIQERDLWFLGLTMDWIVAPAWSIIAQVDAHRAVADSDITGLGDDTIMLTVGGRWRLSRDFALDISVVEDIRVETAPDVTFQLSVRFRPE